MRTGSMINLLMDHATNPIPEIGMGATRLGWTDRNPYTVVKVLSPKKIVVQADTAKRLDTNGMSECQRYEYLANPESREVTVTLRKNGRWIEQGDSPNGPSYALGYREKYFDYSF